MGLSNSTPQRSRKTSSSSFRRQSSILSELSKKVDEKECVFIAMQAEIDKAIIEHNKSVMMSLASEIAAHIMDLNQLRQVDLPASERNRSQRVLYNFELSLAKLKSILNSDTGLRKNAQFFAAEPDIVSNLIRFDDSRCSTLTPLPEYEAPVDNLVSELTVYNEPVLSIEDIVNSVERELDVLKDQLERPTEDINEYYQMDKGVFFLQVRLKNTEISSELALNDKKNSLLEELTEFRAILNQKSNELEEQRQLTQEVNTLELLVDSAATEAELKGIKAKALMFQETIAKSSWDKNKKIQLLQKLKAILNYPTSSTSNEHLYGNLDSLQKDLEELRHQEELDSIQSIDKVLEQENEDVYGNLEIIRQTQRGTVYANADIVRQSFEESKPQEVIHKRPLPLPRNYDDKIINDLPKHWQRLNEIYDSEIITEANEAEVAEIRKQAEVARNLFERKIRRIIEKSEESVEL